MYPLLVAKYTLIEAWKKRLGLLYFGFCLACIAFAYYAKSISIVESIEAFSGFYAFTIRLSAVLILGVYLITTETRALETARIQLALSLPISRSDYCLGKLLAYINLALLMALLATLPLWFSAPSSAVLVWASGFFCELCVIVTVALMLSALFSHPIFAICLLSVFYIFARSVSELYTHTSNIISSNATLFDSVLSWSINLISYLVPKLDQFAPSAWLIYPVTDYQQLITIYGQTVLYGALMIVISLIEIRRREF